MTVLSASLDAVNGAPLVVDPHSDVCLFLLSCALATVVVLFTVQKEEKSDFKLSFFPKILQSIQRHEIQYIQYSQHL